MALRTQNQRETIAVTISSGADGLSDAYDLQGYAVIAIDLPTTWTAAHITFQGCNSSDGTFVDLFDQDAAEVSITSSGSTGRSFVVDATLGLALASHRYLKLRSGDSTTAIAQESTRSLTLVVAPY